MKRAKLDGSLKDIDAVYGAIYASLSDEYAGYGHNLDALWDVLTASIRGPVEIVWKDHAKARTRIGPRADRLIDMLRDVERERQDFRLILK